MALKKWQDRLLLFGIALVVVVGVIVGGVWLSIHSSSPGTNESASDTKTLRAYVGFMSTQIKITNNDTFDWTNVEMEINAGLIRGGCVLIIPRIEAGGKYSVGVMQFAKSDGTRFNPLEAKVLKFSIVSRDANSRSNGVWIGSF